MIVLDTKINSFSKSIFTNPPFFNLPNKISSVRTFFILSDITPKAKKELATLGYEKAMGARPLNRVISDKIKNVLTDEILFGKLKKGGFVKIDFEKEFIFEFKSL